uniref:Bm10323 n=1 Tax=Brugia malayi TaxID=6279 RepID=A0A0J9Y890_BRUMA|nr:Bm10323 [Brugia malayi]
MPEQICYAKLDDELPGSKSVLKWKTSTYFLSSLLYAIQTEYVKQALLNILRRNYNITVDKLEKSLWILSTFGGAVSAMGDYYKHFAKKAELISYNQLQLAISIGDPVLISRCKLYISISLMQTKKYRAAAKIIR